jgi:ATP-dependent exoDNAse (exonuclease V) beta subunit
MIHMTEKEYNEHPGVRRSDLWKISESPEKYKYAVEHPLEPTPALVFGAATHKYILEKDGFDEEYAVIPEMIDRRTKAGKEMWEEFLTKTSGKAAISTEDFKTMTEMRKVLEDNPIANKLLYGKGKTEMPFFWKDKDTHELCKVKLDRLVRLDRRFAVVDYKTAKNAKTDVFIHDMTRYGYTLQAAMYTEGVMKCKRLKYRPDFIFVVQEKTPPYSVNVVYVPSDSSVMQYGIDQFREFIGILHQCKETGYFFGYTGAFGDMSEAYLPGYVGLADGDD